MTDHEDTLAVLRRWTDSGGIWQVTSRRAESVVVTLFTCDGGEEMQRIVSDDRAVIAWIGARNRSDEISPR